MNKNFFNIVFAIAGYLYQRQVPDGLNIFYNNKIFSVGLFWITLKQLIIISGVSIVFAIGLRGTGIRIEYFIFNWLFWFYFSEMARVMSNLNMPLSIKKNIEISFTSFYAGSVIRISSQYLIMLVFLIFVMSIFNYVLPVRELMIAFIGITFISILYSQVVSLIIYKRTFLIELHDFFLQSLLFTSSIIIPISILPSFIIDILVWNPLVHINEFIKEPVTGIKYNYIDIYYPFKFIAILFIFFVPIINYFEILHKEDGN